MLGIQHDRLSHWQLSVMLAVNEPLKSLFHIRTEEIAIGESIPPSM